jgi:hypothetical protein
MTELVFNTPRVVLIKNPNKLSQDIVDHDNFSKFLSNESIEFKNIDGQAVDAETTKRF